MKEMPFVPSENLAGRYQLLSTLSEHGASLTWLAMDLKLEQEVVIKKLPLAKAREWKQLELFEREARTLQHLRHPGIPKLIDFFRSEDKACLNLILEQVQGQNLEQKLASGWRPTEPEVMSLADKVLEILEYLHSHQPPVVHRDIKPSNLMLDAQQQVHLIDFGSVQQALQSKEMTVVGTFGYMAPEQFSGVADQRSDLYSLGATLLHLLSGKPPAELPKKGLKINFQSQVDCSPAFQDWLANLLEPVPDKRCRSAQTARQGLKAVQSGKFGLRGFRFMPREKALMWSYLLIGSALTLYVFRSFLFGAIKPPAPQPQLYSSQKPQLLNTDQPKRIPEFGDALHKGFCLHKPDPRRPAQTSKQAVEYRKLYIEPNLGHYAASRGVYSPEEIARGISQTNDQHQNYHWRQYSSHFSVTTPSDLTQMMECNKIWGSSGFHTYTEALNLIVNWPLDDDSVMTGLYVLATYPEYDRRSDPEQLKAFFNFAFERYFDYQPPKTWKQGHPLAAIANKLTQSLMAEQKYALVFEKLDRVLKKRGRDFMVDDRIKLTMTHASAMYDLGNKTQALNEITHLIAANSKSQLLSEMNVLRNQFDPNYSTPND